MTKPVILLAERDESLRRQVRSLLRRQQCEVVESPDLSRLFLALRKKQTLTLLILDVSFHEQGDGLAAVRQLRQGGYGAPVIILAPHSSEELAIAALKIGVLDYFKPPFTDDAFLASVRRGLAERRSSEPFPQHLPGVTSEHALERAGGALMIGESAPMQAVKAYLAKVAATESNALITGETGTGKELVADFLHSSSRRRHQPFIRLNCAAIPDSLLESELFGYERGAFTGAQEAREGALTRADGGTVFLDEIGDMSLQAQAKMLRAIENREVQRLGGTSSTPLDIRIVAATNQELEQLITEQKFRADLYYRLNVANISLPPLRERKEDLPLLCAHYITEMNRTFGREVEGLTDEAMDALLRHDWPGNVRELKNLVEAAFINLPSRRIALVDLPERFRRRCRETAALPQDERSRLLSALFATKWNKYQAARKLHWSRMTLYRKMAKYHIINSGGSDGGGGSEKRDRTEN